MPAEIYEVVAQGARYWFVFLMALIVWRSYRWYHRDRRQRKKRLRMLPDAGYIGEMVVIRGGAELERGSVLPVPREGTLGYLRTNDLCVPVRGVGNRHLWFRFDDGEGLMVEPYRGRQVSVDGEAFQSRREPLYMAHGSRLYAGEAELRLRLFAGFEATASAGVRESPSGGEGEESASMPPDAAAAWQFAQWQQWAKQHAAQQLAQQAAWQRWMEEQWAAKAKGAEADTEAEWEEEDEAPDDGEPALDEPPASEAGPTFAPVSADAPPDRNQTVFPTHHVFYPPVEDEAAGDDAWPYAPYPQSDAEFVNQGYTYPEYVEDDEADEDMTDAAAPPKSAYIGHDEAEAAKKKLWDRYLGGGRRR